MRIFWLFNETIEVDLEERKKNILVKRIKNVDTG